MKNILLNKKLLFSLIGLIICILIVSCVLVIKKCNSQDIGKQYYDNKVKTFAEENKNIDNCDVVFIGDSLTDDYDLKKYYPEISVLNRGISGDRTKGLLDRMKVSVYDVNPKVVVVLIGGNDILAKLNLDKSLKNYENIINGIKTNLPNTKIIIQSFYPIGEDWTHFNQTMIDTNVKVKALAQKYDCTFVDMYTPLLDNSTRELNTHYTIEGVHLNQTGYETVTYILKPIIFKLLGK
ncbi:MAG: hypothetical protein IJW82_06515 [Clostridia bacterium]|nr:hypothetical protein [Clostridia bacterium]